MSIPKIVIMGNSILVKPDSDNNINQRESGLLTVSPSDHRQRTKSGNVLLYGADVNDPVLLSSETTERVYYNSYQLVHLDGVEYHLVDVHDVFGVEENE